MTIIYMYSTPCTHPDTRHPSWYQAQYMHWRLWCAYPLPAEHFFLELIVTHKQLINLEQTRHKQHILEQANKHSTWIHVNKIKGLCGLDWQNSKNGYKKTRSVYIDPSPNKQTHREAQMDINAWEVMAFPINDCNNKLLMWIGM